MPLLLHAGADYYYYLARAKLATQQTAVDLLKHFAVVAELHAR